MQSIAVLLLLLSTLCLIAYAQPLPQPSPLLSISLANVTATQQPSYRWSVHTAMQPTGLSIRMGQQPGSVVVATNITRTSGGSALVVAGTVQLSNTGALPLQLTDVHVLIQQPGWRQPLPIVVAAAECGARVAAGSFLPVIVQAVATLNCPFAVQLDSQHQPAFHSHSAVAVTAQAQVLNGRLISSAPAAAWLSLPAPAAPTLSSCAVATDTFESGGLFLAPTSLAAGVKLPPLGAGSVVCGEGGVQSHLYRVTFGPFNTSTASCGTFKVMNTVRVNPLGGSQPAVAASALGLVSLTGCDVTELTRTAATAATAAMTAPGTVASNALLIQSMPAQQAAAGDVTATLPAAAAGSTGGLTADTPAFLDVAAPQTALPPRSLSSSGGGGAAEPGLPAADADAGAGSIAAGGRGSAIGSMSNARLAAAAGPAQPALPFLGLDATDTTPGLNAPSRSESYEPQPAVAATQQQQALLPATQQQWQPQMQLQQGALAAGQQVGMVPPSINLQQQSDGLQGWAARPPGAGMQQDAVGMPQQLPAMQQRQRKPRQQIGAALSALARLLPSHKQQQQQLAPTAVEAFTWWQQQQQQFAALPAAPAYAQQLSTLAYHHTPSVAQQGVALPAAQAPVAPAPVPPPTPQAAAAAAAPEEYFYTYEYEAPLTAAAGRRRLHEQQTEQQQQQGAESWLPAGVAEATELLTASRQQHLSFAAGAATGGASGRHLQQIATQGNGPRQQPPAPQPPATAAAAIFGSVEVVEGVTSYKWEPRISLEPQVLSVPQASQAPTTLQYRVQVRRTAQAPATLITGQLHISNAGNGVLRLVQVAVESPAAGRQAWAHVHAQCPSPAATAARSQHSQPVSSSGGSVAGASSLVGLVLPRSQLTCSFRLVYPADAPALSTLAARLVTEGGQELPSKPHAFKLLHRHTNDTRRQEEVKLGACALVSDSFLSPQDAHGVMLPSQLPASGRKAPATSSRGGGGLLVCDSTTFSYSATLGPFEPGGHCGTFKVVSMVRVVPLNNTALLGTAAAAAGAASQQATATSSAVVHIIECQPSAQALQVITPSPSAAQVLPVVSLPGPVQFARTQRSDWVVDGRPEQDSIRLRYNERRWSTVSVQYSRQPGRSLYSLSGIVSIRNPNLLEPLVLLKVAVMPAGVSTEQQQQGVERLNDAADEEEEQQGSSTGFKANLPTGRMAVVSCPRDASGAIVVTGQLVGSGAIECSWMLAVTADSALGVRLAEAAAVGSSGSSNSSDVGGVKLLATAITMAGKEAAAIPVLLSRVLLPAGSRSGDGGVCAALSTSFRLSTERQPDERQHLVPEPWGVSRSSKGLPDVVCDDASIRYSMELGLFGPEGCGEHTAVHVATASSPTLPWSGLALPAASSSIRVAVTGCPGSAATLAVTDLQLQLVRPVTWTVSSQSAVDPSLGALQLAAGSSREVAFTINYLAQAQPPARELKGTVVAASLGSQALLLQHVFVEVLPLGMGHLGMPPVVIPVTCDVGGSTGSGGAGRMMHVPVDTALRCSFAGLLPEGFAASGHAAVTARAVLADGRSTASPRVSFDIGQQPQQPQEGEEHCAIVSDGFVGGKGRVLPQQSSRPASAAAPTRICNTHTVSFVASIGPFGEEASSCGQKLWVVNVARITPIGQHAWSMPSSALTAFQVSTVACDNGSSGSSSGGDAATSSSSSRRQRDVH